MMAVHDKVNILMVDDQPGKLLSYEAILSELNENLIKVTSAKEALEKLLKADVAVVLMDVSMPEIDGFELAEIIRQHPRFQKTAIIFVSAVHLTDLDRLKGYQAGAVDYLSVPIVPEVLRAKVRVFAELHRKSLQLARLNCELEQRVVDRTQERWNNSIAIWLRRTRNSTPLFTPLRTLFSAGIPMVRGITSAVGFTNTLARRPVRLSVSAGSSICMRMTATGVWSFGCAAWNRDSSMNPNTACAAPTVNIDGFGLGLFH
jgi:CheY-like chemotaxis protein